MDETIRVLNEAKARLKEVEEGIVELQIKFEETEKKKMELKEKCDLCKARLERAEKVRERGRKGGREGGREGVKGEGEMYVYIHIANSHYICCLSS